jgi:hypothetical protein
MPDSPEAELPERLPYRPDWFVDRAAELDLVLRKIAQLAEGKPVEKRVIIFHGFRGTGKSWLLRRIQDYLSTEYPQAVTSHIDLDKYSGVYSDQAAQEILHNIDTQIQTRIGGRTVDPHDLLWRQVEHLQDNISHLKEPLVLLVDHVDESPREVLEQLEDRILAPLIVLPRVLIVLAGRGKEYTWKKEEFRLKCEQRDLLSFDLPFTRQQLAKLENQVPGAEAQAAEIFATSRGYPWVNCLLAKESVSKLATLDQCADFMLRGLPVSDEVYDYLQTLCVLRIIHDETILPLLAAYFADPTYATQDHPQRRVREIRPALIQTTLIQWSEASSGYIMDEALSNVLEHRLYLRDRDCWTRLHLAAQELFTAWQANYPRTADRWKNEAEYHEGKLTNGPYWTPDILKK